MGGGRSLSTQYTRKPPAAHELDSTASFPPPPFQTLLRPLFFPHFHFLSSPPPFMRFSFFQKCCYSSTFSQQQPAAEGEKEAIVGLIYQSRFIPKEETSLFGMLGGSYPAWQSRDLRGLQSFSLIDLLTCSAYLELMFG